MAKVIKHFEGFGTSTPYTVPSGKITQIQGSFSFRANVTALTSPSFTFGDTVVFNDLEFQTGFHWIYNADAAWILPFGGQGGSQAATVASVRFVVGTSTTRNYDFGRNGITFAGGQLFAANHNMNNGTGATFSPAPRIYLSAGDTLSFNAVSNSNVGFNFIAIEEDT